MTKFNKSLYIILKGLVKPERDFVLGPGIKIKPLSEKLSVFDLAAAGASGFKEWALLEPLCNDCNCEIESLNKTAITPGYDILNRVWLATSLLVIRGYSNILPLAASDYSWNLVAGISKKKSNNQLPAFNGAILDYHVRYFNKSTNFKTNLLEEDEHWINDNFESFNNLAAKSVKFRLALESAIDWRFSYDTRIAISRIWTGIESLFGVSSELVFRISLLCSNLLEQDYLLRIKLFNKCKKLYGIRSKAVHGDKLSEDDLSTSLLDSDELLKQLLILCINNGHEFNEEDFEKAYFGK